MQGRFFLDVIIRQSSAILELLASEDQSLLIRGNAFLILNLRLNVIDGIGGLYLEGDSLSGEGLDDCSERLAVWT